MSTDQTPDDQALSLEQELEQFRADFDALRSQIAEVIVGRHEVIDGMLTALVAGGHVLLEGETGLGKTLLVRTLADALDLEFRRIQFTPDLMSADVIGTYVVMESHGQRRFEFQQGPIFTHLLLADQINRATPKTQSGLLEGLEEGAVTVANRTYELPRPFFVMATQSQGETEGTFPLPATQLDRFLFKLRMSFPTAEEMEAILDRTTEAETPVAKKVLSGERILEMSRLARRATVAPDVRRQAVALVMATHPEHPSAGESTRRFVAVGAGPRAAMAMILAAKIRAILDGRVRVAAEDVRDVALPALAHRLTLNFEGHAEQVDPDQIVREAIESPKSV